VILNEDDRSTIDRIVGEFGLEVDSIEEKASASGSGTVDVTVVVDSDSPFGLDELAEVSNALDGPAQTWGNPAQKIVLEVTSRGVDTPLETAKQWRRNRSRKVRVRLAEDAQAPAVIGDNGPTFDARIGDVDQEAGRVWLVIRRGKKLEAQWADLAGIDEAVVQVEFSSPPQDELDLLVAE